VLRDYGTSRVCANALHGVTPCTLFFSPIPARDLESNMLDACKESAVKHVVLNRAGAGDYAKSFPGWTAR